MEQSDLLATLARVLKQLGLRYFVTGSSASIVYGEPRFTNDIDVVIDLPTSAIDDFCKAFPAPEFYCSRDAVADAVRRGFQFNVLHPKSGFKIDVIVAQATEYDRLRLSRAVRMSDAGGNDTYFASPEDVIVKKLVYYRDGNSDKHLRDIAGILKVSGRQIDFDYVTQWTDKFGCAEIWAEVRAQVEKS